MTIGVAEPRTTDVSPALRRGLSSAGALIPGIAACAIATGVSVEINRVFPTVSPLLIAIVLGALMANLVAVPERLVPGLQFSAKRLLRMGVALLGLQLALGDILVLGPGVFGMVVAIVVLGIAGTVFMGKLMGLSWTQRMLIACGFSICGAAAVAAADGVIEGEDEEVLTAIALVVVFGTLMIPVIPLLADIIGLSHRQAGMWAGGSIHEVAQVVAAGGAIGAGALSVAVVIKLARVLMLAPVMAVLSLRQRRLAPGTEVRRPPLVPLFVVAFLVCMAIRSTGVVPAGVLDVAHVAQTALLTASMFALGAGVHIATLRKVGMRPLALAAASTVWVGAIALVGVLLVA
ncbi:putative sulfate exporter family transporter [Mycobacterium sp. OTB74]|uniref:YeiH family protein n=1 Tax=Mycobacterium sp. OTB74 TaxID=1853452 RepID=UPI002474CBAD|nr:putative sulfate exporter family transporter [Mycobacterium sp. OTB74]MDH6244305.1 putative integral membrane protein (TIGR00698 family) [Mycobacterium sp. OTB74]